MHAKCTILLGFLLLLSCSSADAANEEFPTKLRGLWGNSKETCDVIRTDKDPAYLHDDAKWLKLTATNVLGSTQGRFFREIPAQMISGTPAELSFEMQSLDEPGTITVLNLSADGHLHETTGGADFLLCSSALAGNEEFPQRMRGFWADKKATCDVLKTKGPAYLRVDQEWLKIAATDVLGSSQGRLLQERRPAQMVNRAPAELSFEIQLLNQPPLRARMEDLTLSLDGRLYETIVGARASGSYERCQSASALQRGSNP